MQKLKIGSIKVEPENSPLATLLCQLGTRIA
jgi:hypothetical protein